MLETIIVPAAVLFFLFVWMLAEEATFQRTMQRIRTAVQQEPAPVPVVTPEVTKKLNWWWL